MSRIGKKPIELPAGVTATISGSTVTVKGPKGTLSRVLPKDITAALDAGVLTVARPTDAPRHKSLHGLSRTLVANMVEGVSKGYTRSLEIQGVGYKAETRPFGINLVVGFSHPVQVKAPDGIKLVVETPTLVRVEGIDKELVGQITAEIRSVRPPEPYKGKGVRYVGERVRRKAGKTGAK
ncbi:MAG TPA: 50S ribosomal protein L6 [Gemmatimonadales bacterium]|jgi:large subunit ribosomal protein L6|nr:50S ribosomal protein L6 [Gemmatimonadales bacterium]